MRDEPFCCRLSFSASGSSFRIHAGVYYDPMEFKNQANNPELAEIKKQLAKWLPTKNVPVAPRDKNLKKK